MSNHTIADEDTPDPWMIEHGGVFYLTCTKGNRIEIWQSSEMENFRHCQKAVVWKPHDGESWCKNVWAPELHRIGSSWYIYTTAAHPGEKKASHATHRTLVLRSDHPDPMQAESWRFLGPVKGMPESWSIDATVFQITPGELYCCYSGWPLGDTSDTQQDLFLIKMASPEEAIPETLTCISCADMPWERCDRNSHGINEGAAWVDMSPHFRGIVYSASGSWTNDYKLALLQYIGQDPLKKSSWRKRETPLLVSDHRPPFGPGHASFVKSPRGSDEIFCVYHSTAKHNDGWNNRKGRVIRLNSGAFESHARPLCCADFVDTAGGYTPSQHSGDLEKRPVKAGQQSKLGKMLDRIKQGP